MLKARLENERKDIVLFFMNCSLFLSVADSGGSPSNVNFTGYRRRSQSRTKEKNRNTRRRKKKKKEKGQKKTWPDHRPEHSFSDFRNNFTSKIEIIKINN